MKRTFLASLFATAALAVACGGSGPTPTPGDGNPTQTPGGASTAASPPATVQPSTSPSMASPTLPSASDVAAAEQSALALFVKNPLVVGNPSAGYVWSGGPDSNKHMSATVKARLAQLGNQGFFRDTRCGEDYISGTQSGLFSAPTVVSTTPAADGSVTVVIRRGPKVPNLTAVMREDNGAWLANDLQSGSGPNASIFAANPHC